MNTIGAGGISLEEKEANTVERENLDEEKKEETLVERNGVIGKIMLFCQFSLYHLT